MALQDTLDSINNLDINDLDWSRVGVWPLAGKAILWLIAMAAIGAATYFFLIKDLNADLQRVAAQETELRQTFQQKAFQASRLEQYRELMARMEQDFAFLVSQLPEKTQVPGLLDDIDEKGRDSGLEIVSIKLQPEVKGDVYVELPIEVIVTGSYHDFGTFISNIAAMSRIVTLHDLSVQPLNESSELRMSVVAKTYRYLSEEELEGAAR